MTSVDVPATAALDAARAILAGFDTLYRLFRAASRDARRCFEQDQWVELRALTRARIDMYGSRVSEAVETITREHPFVLTERSWPAIKIAYASLLANHEQPELAETFYNSVACRLLNRTYYHNEYIFWRPQVSTE